jgi:hypothetical protein
MLARWRLRERLGCRRLARRFEHHSKPQQRGSDGGSQGSTRTFRCRASRPASARACSSSRPRAAQLAGRPGTRARDLQRSPMVSSPGLARVSTAQGRSVERVHAPRAYPARALQISAADGPPRGAALLIVTADGPSWRHETGSWSDLAVLREATTSPATRDTQERPAGPKPRLWEQLARRIPEVDGAGVLVGTTGGACLGVAVRGEPT